MPKAHQRRSTEETWRLLEGDGLKMPRNSDGSPLIPVRMPSYDDNEPLGFSYFRTKLVAADLANLSLPRMFFGRSLLEAVTFHNTDLSESRMCWNDFESCDFSHASLVGCDFRASNYVDCNFSGANLTRADLRMSGFENCDFSGAVLVDAISDRESAEKYGLLECLTEEQKAAMQWHEEPGEEPGGG